VIGSTLTDRAAASNAGAAAEQIAATVRASAVIASEHASYWTSGLDNLASSGSCHRSKAAAFR
jgi:hypothetical protein